MLFAMSNNDLSTSSTAETAEFKVPAGADHVEKICTVCHEKINLAWDDDCDEWVYKNAIMTDSKELIHASCRGK